MKKFLAKAFLYLLLSPLIFVPETWAQTVSDSFSQTLDESNFITDPSTSFEVVEPLGAYPVFTGSGSNKVLLAVDLSSYSDPASMKYLGFGAWIVPTMPGQGSPDVLYVMPLPEFISEPVLEFTLPGLGDEPFTLMVMVFDRMPGEEGVDPVGFGVYGEPVSIEGSGIILDLTSDPFQISTEPPLFSQSPEKPGLMESWGGSSPLREGATPLRGITGEELSRTIRDDFNRLHHFEIEVTRP